MQVYVQQHQVEIATNLVDEKKLKVSYELLESQMHDRLKREITIMEEKLKPKIKKRLKEKTL